MIDACGDNRFEIIREAKEALIASTNITQSPKEMAVLNDFLFRCWQMGWLKKYEQQPTIQPQGIDKDRLIEELERQCAIYDEAYEIHGSMGCHFASEGIKLAIRRINQQPTSDGWIPVSERLPKVKKMVLVTYRHTQGYEYNEIAYRGEDGEWYSSSFDWLLGNDSVIAWQPLPPAYKE